MKYQFMQQQRPHFALSLMCRVLQVTRSAYYAWLQRVPSAWAQQDQQLTPQIEAIHKQSRRSYGSPRVYVELQAQGVVCSRKRVARLMRASGLVARQRRRMAKTTDSEHGLPVAVNVVQQQFDVGQLNQVWAGDITYIGTREGWLYLAVVLDLGSRRVLGWHMAASLEAPLVVKALEMAWQQRGATPAAGLLHHSDRGSQYASGLFQAALAQRGIACSMSGKGNCWDNAVVESFFATLKTECDMAAGYATRDAARSALFDYIEVFYNRQRRHSTLGYLSPAAYEEQQLLRAA
jgi:putative transposase